MRVFLDANILFSASAKDSATRRLLDTAFKHADVLSSPHAVEEARRNLELKRPKQIGELEKLQQRITMTHAIARIATTIDLPDQDVPILAGAVGAKCTHLWTSDKRHFGRFYGKRVHGVHVVSSIMLANELMKQGGTP